MSDFLRMLVDMGFPRDKAEKALTKTGNSGVQPAMDWLLEHPDDGDAASEATYHNEIAAGGPDIDTTATASSNPISLSHDKEPPSSHEHVLARSIKCDQCGKLLRSEVEAQTHAMRTEHSQFSESSEEVPKLTDAEKKEQLAKLQEILAEKRRHREEQERQEELKRERQRRIMGKDVGQARQKHDELEMMKLAEERRRDKLEEQQARQRVLHQIELDRQARAAASAVSKMPAVGVAPESSATAAAAAAAAVPAAKAGVTYEETRLQIRLQSGTPLTHVFSAREPLAAVRLFCQTSAGAEGDIASGNFTFSTTFPRRIFTEEDMEAPLASLGLVPSAVLMVTRRT